MFSKFFIQRSCIMVFFKKQQPTGDYMDSWDVRWLISKNEQEGKVKVIPFIQEVPGEKVTVLIDGRVFERADYKLMPAYQQYWEKHPNGYDVPGQVSEDLEFQKAVFEKAESDAREQAKAMLFDEVIKNYCGEGYSTTPKELVSFASALPQHYFQYGEHYQSYLNSLPPLFSKHLDKKYHASTHFDLISRDRLPEMVEAINEYATTMYQKELKKLPRQKIQTQPEYHR